MRLVGRNLGGRIQHKAPHEHTRMGHGQGISNQLLITDQKQIQIDGSGPPGDGPHASQLILDASQSIEELRGGQGRHGANHTVAVRGLPLRSTDRDRPAPAADSRDVDLGFRFEGAQRSSQLLSRVTDIRAESD